MATFVGRSASALRRSDVSTKILLSCGAFYGLTYILANDVVAAAIWGDYNRIDQAVSELSAVGATSRPFLIAMNAIWVPALVAFGIGVRRSAGENRWLRIAGAVLVAHGFVALLWLPFPMTARADIVVGSDMGINDLGHFVMSAVTGLFVMAEIGFAAAGLGRGFRIYSLATALVVILFGAYLTGTLAPNVGKGEPTPWMGFFERVGIGAWLAWMTVLGMVLWQNVSSRDSTRR